VLNGVLIKLKVAPDDIDKLPQRTNKRALEREMVCLVCMDCQRRWYITEEETEKVKIRSKSALSLSTITSEQIKNKLKSFSVLNQATKS
jgi:CBS-domain-containing membrane protein